MISAQLEENSFTLADLNAIAEVRWSDCFSQSGSVLAISGSWVTHSWLLLHFFLCKLLMGGGLSLHPCVLTLTHPFTTQPQPPRTLYPYINWGSSPWVHLCTSYTLRSPAFAFTHLFVLPRLSCTPFPYTESPTLSQSPALTTLDSFTPFLSTLEKSHLSFSELLACLQSVLYI